MNPTQLSDAILKHSIQENTFSHYKLLKKSLLKGALYIFTAKKF